MITITKEQLTAVFLVWERERRENPDVRYTDEELGNMSLQKYSEECTSCFIRFLEEMKKGPDKSST